MKIKIVQILIVMFFGLICSCKPIRVHLIPASTTSSSVIYCFDTLNCIAVGTYTTTSNARQPLVAITNDGGHTFVSNPPTAFQLPADALQGDTQVATLTAITCFSLFYCLTVGYYTNTLNAVVPLIAISFDGGQTFSTSPTPEFNPTVFIPPSDALTGANEAAFFLGLQCTDVFNCVAFGQYSNATLGFFSPLEAISNNGGQIFAGLTASESYIPPSDSSVFPAPLLNYDGAFSGAQCPLVNFCIAAGYYSETQGINKVPAPLIAINNNAGYVYTGYSGALNPLPEPYFGSNLFGITCLTGINVCLVSGAYQPHVPPDSILPLVGRVTYSLTAAPTVTYNSPSAYTPPPDADLGTGNLAVFNAIFCFNALNCLALGYYSYGPPSLFPPFLPLRAFSVDGGQTFVGVSGAAPSIILPSNAKPDAEQTASFGELLIE